MKIPYSPKIPVNAVVRVMQAAVSLVQAAVSLGVGGAGGKQKVVEDECDNIVLLGIH